jgi:hypothetical protein
MLLIRTLLEQLTVAKLTKNFTIYATKNSISVFTTACHRTVLSDVNPDLKRLCSVLVA